MRHLFRATLSPSVGIPFTLFVLLDGFILVTDLRWVGELGWTIEWANAGLFLSSSLLAGIAAFLSNPYFSPAFRHVMQAGSRPARARLFCSIWLRNLCLGVVGHAVVVGVALLATAVTGPTDAILPLAFLYSLLPILVFVSLGTLAGAYAPHPVVAALVLGLAYLISYNAATGVLQLPIVVGDQTAGMVGLEYTPSTAVLWSGVAFAMAGVLFCAGLLVTLQRRGGIATGIVVLACLAAFVGPSIAGLHLPGRVETTGRAISRVCAGSAPRVCLARGHTRNLATIARRVDAAAAPLRAAGVTFAGVRLDEPGLAYAPGTAILSMSPADLNLADFSTRDYAKALTEPADCAAFWGTGAVQSTSAVRLLSLSEALTDWIYARLDRAGRDSANADHDDAWAKQAYSALAGCRVSAALSATVAK